MSLWFLASGVHHHQHREVIATADITLSYHYNILMDIESHAHSRVANGISHAQLRDINLLSHDTVHHANNGLILHGQV